jgi:hypothetical protein
MAAMAAKSRSRGAEAADSRVGERSRAKRTFPGKHSNRVTASGADGMRGGTRKGQPGLGRAAYLIAAAEPGEHDPAVFSYPDFRTRICILPAVALG